MNDLISRQAVEEIINDIRDCISVEGYCAILERLKKLPPVNPQEPKTCWIPVSEGLPYIGQRVLVTTETLDNGKKVTGTYYDRYGFVCGNVLAWMPLPKPYMAESEGTE